MYDMTIRLQSGSGKCLYQQIYEHIKQEIMEGKLLTGEKLPSTRSLAEYLQVSRSTIDAAYGQLQSEGYIEPHPYRGYFVSQVEELLWLGNDIQQFAKTEYIQEEKGVESKFLEQSRQKRTNGDKTLRWQNLEECILFDFNPNHIDMSGFPFGIWKKITKNILNGSNSDLFSQGHPQGDWELRQTISRYLHSSRGVNCVPEQIIVGAGNDYLLLLLEKILGRHIRIAMENPTYIRAYQIFQSFAYPIVTVDMDEGGMKVADLERENVKIAYVMPSHQFPTGTVMPIGRRTELLRWADGESDRYLIEDDYDSEFRYRGKPIPSLQSTDEHEKVIYIGTFSKAIAPAIRVSYMVLPEPLLRVYQKDCMFYSSTVSRIDQRILNEFIREGYFERHLNKMRKIYKEKHELLLEQLRPFQRAFRISGEHAGLHLLLTSLKNQGEQELINLAKQNQVKVYGLSDSYIPANYSNPEADKATVLIGYGGLTQEQIIEGVKRLKQIWTV